MIVYTQTKDLEFTERMFLFFAGIAMFCLRLFLTLIDSKQYYFPILILPVLLFTCLLGLYSDNDYFKMPVLTCAIMCVLSTSLFI